MYCEPCRVERLGTARFCVICGGKLVSRPRAEIEAELAHVLWLVEELEQWDSRVVVDRAREYLAARYHARRKVLISALTDGPAVTAAPEAAAAVPPPRPTFWDDAAAAKAGAVASDSWQVLPADKAGPAPKTTKQRVEEAAERAQAAGGGAAAHEPGADEAAAHAAGQPQATGDAEAPTNAPGEEAPRPSAKTAAEAAAAVRAMREAEANSRAAERRAANAKASAPGVLLDVERDAPSTDDRIVAEASTWSRIWKPFLSESVFWFVGAFLILSGLFYLVADSWSGMTSVVRALVVFGIASGWTLGFSAWAQFLWRRDATRSAARVLKLIGAAMAPLAPLAVGPVVLDQPLLTSVLVLIWSGVAAALALTVTRDVQQGKSLRFVPGAMLATSLMMGLAPLIAGLHGAALGLMAVPVGLLWANSRSEVRTQSPIARAFAFLAPLYLAVLFGGRLHYALAAENLSWGTWAPFLALALTAALELRSPVGPDGRPKWERAADPTSILVVAGQLGLMAWAAVGEAPAFFLTSVIGAHTTWRMLKGSTSPLAPRWIYGLYGFAYFAWQSCGQLVPGVIKHLVQQVKEQLGYQPEGTLPPSYDAIYAAVFVIAGAILAIAWLKGDARRRAWAEPLLRCTWVTSILVALLAIASVGEDVRPALVSIPLVVTLCLGMGVWLDRPAFTRTGAALTLPLVITLIAWRGGASAALLVAVVALALAILSLPMAKAHREPLSLASGLAVLVAAVLAWLLPANASQVVALVVAVTAAWLVARNLDLDWMQQASWVLASTVVARAVVLWAPEYTALAIAGTALTLGLIARGTGRWGHAEPASAVAAMVAPLWQFVLQEPSGARVFLGAVMLLSAAALAVGARRTEKDSTAGWRDAVALCFLSWALLPGEGQLQLWRGWRPIDAVAGYAVLGVLASVWATLVGRQWRAALLASLAISCGAFAWVYSESLGVSAPEVALLASVGALLTMRALLPSISVPIATVFAVRALIGHPFELLGLAVGLSVLALFEEWDLTWNHALGKRAVAWAASLSALFVLGALLLDTNAHWHFREDPRLWIVAAFLPLLWVRATRSGVLAFTLAPLLFLAADPESPQRAAWIVVGVLVCLTHLVTWVTPLRKLMFGAEDAERVRRQFAPWALSGAALLGAGLVLDHGSGWPWALLFLLASSELLAARWPVAAAFGATLDPAVFGAPVLIAVCFLERIIPGLVSRALGAKPHPSTVPSAVWSAVALGTFVAATQTHPQWDAPAWILGGTLVAAAVLLDLRWLLVPAVLAAALPVSMVERARQSSELLPSSAWIAVAGALFASLLRKKSWEDGVRGLCAKLKSPLTGDLGSPLWVGAALAATALLMLGGYQPSTALAVPLFITGALLFATPDRIQVGFASALAATMVFVIVPLPVGAAVLGGVGFVLCLGGAWLEGRHPGALAWHHAGWVLSLIALGGANSLHHPATAIAWGFAAACAVVVAQRNPAVEFVRWVGLGAGAHVALFFLGLHFSHGAPRELILPWIATASLILGAAALRFAKSERTAQRLGSGFGLMMLGGSELMIGLALLPGGELREALVASVGVGVALWALASRVASDDDTFAASLAGLLIPLGFVAVRRLGFSAEPDVVEALAALVAGAGVGGLARVMDEGALPKSARVARAYAFAWPLLGLLAVPWHTPWTVGLLMLAQSAHFAVVSRDPAVKRRAALLSTAAFNAAMAAGFFASGAHTAEYLLIPFGISLLTLLKVFEGDLADSTRVKLRAVAVSIVYGAAAARPLMFDTPGAMWLCVGLCVVGIAFGVVVRIRSYVYMGTAFIVTTVIANLIRYGVREPRIGALFLSGLGLGVVAFMVLVTTRRAELLARYKHARSMLENWDG